MAQESSPLFFDRYELKYIIPIELVEPISRFVEIYCELDPYCLKSEDRFYMINSLYLDSDEWDLWRMKDMGITPRLNIRVRAYGETPKAPFFFEVKHKERGFVKKTRGKVFLENWSEYLINPSYFAEHDRNDPSRKNIEKFLSAVNNYRATPKILTQYRRRAYASVVDEYARVTFDKALRFCREENYNVIPDEARMSHYDNELIFENEGGNVILELKCPPQVPLWMVDLIRTFNLDRSSFSKFGNSAREIIREFTPHGIQRVSIF
jgi:hypothetical protein